MPEKVFTEQSSRVIGVTDDGVHHCSACGRSWQSGKQYPRWPIRFRLSQRFKFSKHGAQVGWADMSCPIIRTFIAIGWLRIALGPAKVAPPYEFITDKSKWILVKEAEHIINGVD